MSVPAGYFIETVPFPDNLSNTAPMPPPQSYDAVWWISETTLNQEYLIGEYSCVSSDMLEIWREPPVFPIPQNTIEGMTTINLQTDDYYDVEYSRFYLGILSD